MTRRWPWRGWVYWSTIQCWKSACYTRTNSSVLSQCPHWLKSRNKKSSEIIWNVLSLRLLTVGPWCFGWWFILFFSLSLIVVVGWIVELMLYLLKFYPISFKFNKNSYLYVRIYWLHFLYLLLDGKVFSMICYWKSSNNRRMILIVV